MQFDPADFKSKVIALADAIRARKDSGFGYDGIGPAGCIGPIIC
jgi:hypothetical protein